MHDADVVQMAQTLHKLARHAQAVGHGRRPGCAQAARRWLQRLGQRAAFLEGHDEAEQVEGTRGSAHTVTSSSVAEARARAHALVLG